MEASPLELALIENIVREDLTPIEEARTIVLLLYDLDVTATALAKRLGRSRADLAHTVRLLELPDQALDLINDGVLSKAHGKALLTEPDHRRRRHLARRAAEHGWSVRALEAQIGQRPRPGVTRPDPPPRPSGGGGQAPGLIHASNRTRHRSTPPPQRVPTPHQPRRCHPARTASGIDPLSLRSRSPGVTGLRAPNRQRHGGLTRPLSGPARIASGGTQPRRRPAGGPSSRH